MKDKVTVLKSNKMLSALLIVLWIALLLVEGLTFGVIWKLDMLPVLYLAIIAVIFVLLWAVIGVLFFRKKAKGQSGRRVVALLLVILIVFGCTSASGVVSRLGSAINTVTGNTEMTTVMTVYVRADDQALNIEDTADYTYAVLRNTAADKTRQALQTLEQTLGIAPAIVEYDFATEAAVALYTGVVDAILMSDSFAGLLMEMKEYKDFDARTRVLYEVSIVEQVTPPKAPVSGNTSRPAVGGNNQTSGEKTPVVAAPITETPFILYLSGNDTRSAKLVTSRSDVNILAVINPVTKQILLVNTPRDYYIPHPLAPNGELDKLTHLGNDGIKCSISGLESLYDERVDFYAQINFAGFEKLIDAIGGITLYFNKPFLAYGQTQIYEGENYLTGAQALHVARDRDSFADGDNSRGRNQMKIIKAVVQKIASGAILSNYEEVIDSLEGMFVADLSKEDVAKLVKMQLSDLASWNIQSYAVTGEGGTDRTYTAGYAYVMYVDQDRVDFGKELIDRVLAGEVLTEQDVVYPG